MGGILIIGLILVLMIIGIVLANHIVETKIIMNNLADDIVALEVKLKELERKFDFEIKYRKDLFDDGRYNR